MYWNRYYNINKILKLLNSEGDKPKAVVKKEPEKPKILTYDEIMNDNRHFLNRFDMSQRDAFNLIYTLKDYNIFSRLPLIAMNILNDVNNHPDYKALENVHKNMIFDLFLNPFDHRTQQL